MTMMDYPLALLKCPKGHETFGLSMDEGGCSEWTYCQKCGFNYPIDLDGWTSDSRKNGVAKLLHRGPTINEWFKKGAPGMGTLSTRIVRKALKEKFGWSGK